MKKIIVTIIGGLICSVTASVFATLFVIVNMRLVQNSAYGVETLLKYNSMSDFITFVTPIAPIFIANFIPAVVVYIITTILILEDIKRC